MVRKGFTIIGTPSHLVRGNSVVCITPKVARLLVEMFSVVLVVSLPVNGIDNGPEWRR
jgi:hypothetical protein